ncbi:hypothetical protein [Roseibium sp.]|uniref:hypothetical protein n=1 Tax=Roseibium sp. TaxID=1936156 RepID=UPI0009292970|nr:hypothetical protein BKI51_01045 [Alphaproteobacteria bacterium AO1-B]
MSQTASQFETLGNASYTEFGEPQGRAVESRFYPIMGKNVSIQAIVEGSLLAQIELDPIPEYGIFAD